MNDTYVAGLLNLLDFERQTLVFPGVRRISDGSVWRDIGTDGSSCEIVYSSCTDDEVDDVIQREIHAAVTNGYTLEWKVYSHDRPHGLGERLAAAGLVPGPLEAFMVFPANSDGLQQLFASDPPSPFQIRQVADKDGMRDVQLIAEEVAGRSCEKDVERHWLLLQNNPANMSMYVAYVRDEPAACGRIYFHEDSMCAGLYGGQTRERFRKRGLFTQIVGVRIREAVRRGVRYVCVDALPTSEPILRKRGFEVVTHTQPYCLPQ